MLRTFVQILRSGVTGRKSLGSAPKRLILQWLERADVRKLLQASIGNAPSLRHLSEINEGAVRNTESQWHRIYIGWHSILGQLKVKQRAEETKNFWGKKK